MSLDVHLPPEVWYEILTNLPAKSILRCRSVCKKWYSLISSPHFITAQTLNHSTTNRVLVPRYDLVEDLQKFSSHDESFVESHEHDDFPKQFKRGIVLIVGSCNGLVCLQNSDHQVHSFLIWNPSIRKSVQLPSRPTCPKDNINTSYLLGFGFDSHNGDYKVLRVGSLIPPGTRSFGVPFVSEIFDLRKGVWRAISSPITPPRFVINSRSCVYFHGSLHWMGYEDEDQPNHVIVSFNLSSEVSREMGMPGDATFKDVQDRDSRSISANNGLLSVALLRMQQGDVSQDCCTVWTMKEYGVTESWTKLFNIELPFVRTLLGLLRFWENGEVIIAVRGGGNVLVVYNPENKTSKALLSVSVDELTLQVGFYKESLVLL